MADKILLYRCPGEHRAWSGQTFTMYSAETQEEADERAKDGWSFSLAEAVDRAVMAKAAEEPPDLPTSMTPAEKAQAAEKALAEAAEKALSAKRALEADTEKAAEAGKLLAEATEKADAANKALELAAAEAASANKARADALNKAQVAEKAKKSSALHAEAAETALNNAASRVLTAGKLLKAATDKAMAEAEAAEKALAKAAGKGAGKPEPKPEKPETDESDPIGPTFEHVKGALTELKEKRDAKAVTKLLKRFGAKTAPELSEDKYAEVIAAVTEALKEND